MSIFYKKSWYDDGEVINPVTVTFATLAGVVLLIVVLVLANAWWRVFSASQTGKAELAQAEYNRQIIVRTAQAKKDSAQLEAEAEILRAQGVAKANEIVAQGLGGPEGYLRYLYIHMLSEQNDKQIIYIPTEAGLPILEASKR